MPNLETQWNEIVIGPNPSPDRQRMLEVLDDAASRRLLRVLSEPKTAAAVADACDMPTSTMYRKLTELVETSLVEKSYRGKPGRGHITVYRRRIDGLHIQFGDRQ